MAESCDRLVRNFRKQHIDVHIVHFTNRKRKFHTVKTVSGSYSAVPIYNSEEFTLNIASQFVQQLSSVSEVKYIVAFGGDLPIVLSPILSQWLDKELITFIRGNDFDEAIFSKRREALLYALKYSRFIFTVTQEKKQKIERLINHSHTYFTHNGINCKLWEPAKSQLTSIEELKKKSEGKKRIVIVGQLKAKKGIIEFSDTFSTFTYRESYEVWMIGDIEESAKNHINTLGMHVRFFSFVDKSELICYYHAADIVLIPSFYDGMPNVLLEAGASKNVVVASDVGGIKDVIIHEEDGFLFNPLKPSSLLEVLTKVHKLNGEKKNEISSNLYNKINSEYTENKEITNYITKLEL